MALPYALRDARLFTCLHTCLSYYSFLYPSEFHLITRAEGQQDSLNVRHVVHHGMFETSNLPASRHPD
jgi:hypothetical protein